MSFNGYKNYETWLFMVHFGDYLFESLKEQKEEYDEDEFNYETVYNTVESLIDEMMDGIKDVHIGSSFLNDIVSASLGEVDIKEIADLLFADLKEE